MGWGGKFGAGWVECELDGERKEWEFVWTVRARARILGRVSVHFVIRRLSFISSLFFRGSLFRGRTDDGTDFPRAFLFFCSYLRGTYFYLDINR